MPIIRGDLHLFADEDIPYYRDINDHVSRVVEQLDRTRELINNARDIHIALATNRQNEVTVRPREHINLTGDAFRPLRRASDR